MAQSAVTVRIDSEIKSQFDKLCEQFGMSANTAFNIFVNAVVRSRSIPFTIRGGKTEQPSALDLFMQQRRAAETNLEPEMTLDEINAEIRAAREEAT
jgi:DNA-damage-inducible protein J